MVITLLLIPLALSLVFVLLAILDGYDCNQSSEG